jgi:Tol biopolymer transport system component
MRHLLVGGAVVLAWAVSGVTATADETARVSNAPSGRAGSAASWSAAISADGNVVAFVSVADDLVPGDTNGRPDVFVFDRSTGVTTRVNVSSSGAEADGDSSFPSLSSDGRFVAFISEATNLVGSIASNQNVFVRDRQLGTTTLVTADVNGAGGSNSPFRFTFNTSISADGQKVAYVTSATNLVQNDANGTVPDAFVWDAATGTNVVASVDASGVPVDDVCWSASISGDGKVVAFETKASNLPDPPPSGDDAIYAKDLATGAVERIDLDSSGVGGTNSVGLLCGLSDDGTLVLFVTQSPLVPDDVNGSNDVYLRDRVARTTERVSSATGGGPLPSPDGGDNAAMSSDGRFVAFDSRAKFTELDANSGADVFVRDRLHDVTTIVSVGTLDQPATSDVMLTRYPDWWQSPGNFMSGDGRVIVFNSDTTAFAPNDGNADCDVFVRTRDLAPATAVHYGAGFPGRNGVVPNVTPDHDPWRGSPLVLDVVNSSGVATTGYLLMGIARAADPTARGGTLLVDPTVVVPLALSPAGGSYGGDVPTDAWADGLVLDLQVLELDPWAWRGVSFSDGLELTLGDG